MTVAKKAKKKATPAPTPLTIVGDLVLTKSYARVKEVGKKNGVNFVVVQDVDNGMNFKIMGEELLDKLSNGCWYAKEEPTTMTNLARVLTSSHAVPLTVSFNKKDGSERILRGKFLSIDEHMGRSNVEDLDLPMGDHRLRQVDHREINWLIVNGVRYYKK